MKDLMVLWGAAVLGLLLAVVVLLAGCVTGGSVVVVQVGCGSSLDVEAAGLPIGGSAEVECPKVVK